MPSAGITSTLLDLVVEQCGELRDDLTRPRMQARLVRRHEQHAARSRAEDLVDEVAHESGELGRETSAFEPPTTSSGRPVIVGTLAERPGRATLRPRGFVWIGSFCTAGDSTTVARRPSILGPLTEYRSEARD